MFMGFTLHFYIIFGTNLLTGGPTRIAIFCLFQCFEEKEYQMESKRDKTNGDFFEIYVIFGKKNQREMMPEGATRQGARPPP